MVRKDKISVANVTSQRTSNYVTVTIKTHKDKNGGHPHVVLGNVDKNHVSVGLSTKATKGKGSKNYRLEKSPFNDGKQSFMRRQGTVAPKKEYTGKRSGSLTPKDYAQAKIYGERAKEKYFNKKSNDVPTLFSISPISNKKSSLL